MLYKGLEMKEFFWKGVEEDDNDFWECECEILELVAKVRLVVLEGELLADVLFGHDAVEGAIEHEHEPSSKQNTSHDDPTSSVDMASVDEKTRDKDQQNTNDLSSSHQKT